MNLRRNWTKKEQADLLIQLGQALSEGYPLAAAVQMQLFQKNVRHKKRMQQVILALKAGERMNDILEHLHFPGDILSAIYFSEESGELGRGMVESGRTMLRREEQKQKMRRLMRYPLFLIWVFTFMLYIIGHYLIPNYLSLYQSFSIDLPVLTKILLYLSEHIVGIAAGCLILFGLIIFSSWIFRQLPIEVRLNFIARTPLVRHYFRLYCTHQFSFAFGSLVRSGRSFQQAVEILAEKGATAFLRYEGTRLNALLRKGTSFESAMTDCTYYRPEFIWVIHQAVSSGKLGQTIYQYSEQVLSKMENSVKTFLSICQPVLLIVIGGLVLGLFLSILLPIFEMVNGI